MKPPKRLPKLSPYLAKAETNLRKQKSKELQKRNIVRKSRLPTEKDFPNIHEEQKLYKKQTEYSQNVGIKRE